VIERIPRPLVDVLATAFVVLATLANRLGNGYDSVLVGLAAAASAAVFFRRQSPRLVLGFLTAANVAFTIADQPALVPALVVAFYTVGELLPRRESLRVAAAAFIVNAAVSPLHHHGSAAFSNLVIFVGAWAIGSNVRTRRERAEDRSRQAVADERARIARELHDMVTHTVSVMVVQAAAGNDVFDERPDQARAALRAIEETGRRALGELRRLLDVVAEDDSAGYEPQPGLRRLDDLVASVRATGLGVDLTVEGTPQPLSPALELSAFRIVQEALTNVLKHARASRASVQVRYTTDALELEVADDGVGADSVASGRGLVGMRERVALFGGEVAAGARPGGGFAVRARMPLEAS
jgi:signal transduction histidine kinase